MGIKVVINGKEEELERPVTVAELLRQRGVNINFIAVARNGEVLRRDEYGRVLVQEGDVLEIVRPVGGG